MFDNLKSMGALAGVMKDLPRIKEKMEEMKTRLSGMTVEAETGGGAVRATANGQLQIVSIRCDQALISGLVDANDPADAQMAEDLITGAVNAALTKARELAEDEMRRAAEELGLPLPAGGLGGLLS